MEDWKGPIRRWLVANHADYIAVYIQLGIDVPKDEGCFWSVVLESCGAIGYLAYEIESVRVAAVSGRKDDLLVYLWVARYWQVKEGDLTIDDWTCTCADRAKVTEVLFGTVEEDDVVSTANWGD